MKTIYFYLVCVCMLGTTYFLRMFWFFGSPGPDAVIIKYYDLDLKLGYLVDNHPKLEETRIYKFVIEHTYIISHHIRSVVYNAVTMIGEVI